MKHIGLIFIIIFPVLSAYSQQNEGLLSRAQPQKITSDNRKIQTETEIQAIELNNQGVKLFLDKDHNSAIDYFRRAADLEPELSQVKINLAYALYKIEQFDESAEICRTLMKENAEGGKHYWIYGSVLYKWGKFTESIAALQKALEFEPENAEILGNLGTLLLSTGEKAKAFEYFEKSLEIDPASPEVLNNYGTILFENGSYHKAVEVFKQAIKYQPDVAQAHNNLGVVLGFLGKKKQARNSFLEAVRLAPDWSYPQYNLALSYLAEGKRDVAREHFSILRKLDSELALKFQKEFYKGFVVDVSEIR